MEDTKHVSERQDDTRWLMLGLVCVGTFMGTLDVSIVNVALPTLTRAFNTNVAVSQWFVLAYSFVITVFLLTFGRLGDLVGRRCIYVAGTIVFVAGSLACGLSVSALMLIVSRAAQGLGSAVTMSAGPALVTSAFPSSERGKALGFIGTSVALGLLAGPVIGGVLVQFASWRWLFLINVPIGLALAFTLGLRFCGSFTSANGRMDIWGSVLLTLSLSALVLGITYGGRMGWTSPATAAVFVCALLLGSAFVAAERRVKNALLDLRLFSNREFAIGAVTGWANYAAMMPVSVFLPFYLENILKLRPDQVGLVLASGPLVLAFTAPAAGTLSDRIGSRLLTSVGLLIAAAAMFSMRWLTTASGWHDVVWRLALASFGSALFVSPNSSAIMGAVRPGQLGVASGAIALVRNLGMLCGIAVGGAIISTVQQNFFFTGEVRPNPELRHYSFFVGLRAVFLASAAIALFGAFLSALRVRPGDREALERAG